MTFIKLFSLSALLLYNVASAFTVEYDSTYQIRTNKYNGKYLLKVVAISTEIDNRLSFYLLKRSDVVKRFDTLQTIIQSSINGEDVSFDEPVIIEDVNFDGNSDLRYVYNAGNQGENIDYSIWLFDSQAERLIYNEDFTEMVGCNTGINTISKTITSWSLDGCLGNCHSTSVFKVVNNKPVLIEEESQVMLDVENQKEPTFIYTHKKLKNKEMVLISKFVGTVDYIDSQLKKLAP